MRNRPQITQHQAQRNPQIYIPVGDQILSHIHLIICMEHKRILHAFYTLKSQNHCESSVFLNLNGFPCKKTGIIICLQIIYNNSTVSSILVHLKHNNFNWGIAQFPDVPSVFGCSWDMRWNFEVRVCYRSSAVSQNSERKLQNEKVAASENKFQIQPTLLEVAVFLSTWWVHK